MLPLSLTKERGASHRGKKYKGVGDFVSNIELKGGKGGY